LDLRRGESSRRLEETSYFKVMKSRRMRRARHVARMEEITNTRKILVGKREGKGSLWISKCK